MKNLVMKSLAFITMWMTAISLSAEKIQTVVGCLKYEIDTETKEATVIRNDADEFRDELTEVTIPESITFDNEEYAVTCLGTGCFYRDYPNLKHVTIPPSVKKLGAICFMGCKAIGYIILPPSLRSVGWGCFANSGLSGMVIPPSVTSVGGHCFHGCSDMFYIYIPYSVTSLGEDCFHGCSELRSIYLDERNRVYDSRENCKAIIETATNTMVFGSKRTVIPSSVTSLGDWCFAGQELYTIDIPYSVTSLGKGCFYHCPMKSMVIPSSVTSVGAYCFHQCRSLESVTIPSSVTSLGECFLGFCESLKRVECHIPSPIESDLFNFGDLPEGPVYGLDYPFYYWPLWDLDYPLPDPTPVGQVTLLVPYNSLDSYKATSPWNSLGTITDIEGISGINAPTISDDNEVAGTYGIDGSRKSAMTTGLNIIRMQDGKAKKVFVK